MLDLKTLKVISIQKNKDLYHIVYMRNQEGKHEMELLKNGVISGENIKPLLLSYGVFLEYEVDKSKITYQFFDVLYLRRYINKFVWRIHEIQGRIY